MIRALQALLETAVKFTEEGGTVRVSSDAEAASPSVVIESEGRSIPAPALPKFFNLFSIGQAITPGGDLGLGPPMACRILALFGASVSVRNREAEGIELTVLLKEAAPDAGQLRALESVLEDGSRDCVER